MANPAFLPISADEPTTRSAKPSRALLIVSHLVMLAVGGCAVYAAISIFVPEQAVPIEQAVPALSSDSRDASTRVLMRGGHPTPYRILPRQYSVAYPIPVTDQVHRGMCYAFATIGVIEHSYRIQGIRKGLLKPEEYVQFSEQAFGVNVVNLCDEAHDECAHYGELAWHSTQGGNIGVVPRFAKSLSTMMLPVAVCPYQTELAQQFICDGLEDALKTNPVRMNVERFETFYDIPSAKEALVDADGYSMSLSVSWSNTAVWLPCRGEYANDPQCEMRQGRCQHQCPLNLNLGAECCRKLPVPMYNADAELWWDHTAMDELAGHLVQVVGYSDTYRTEKDDVGGFIFRNSWGAGMSHSIAYFKREISDTAELEHCPNSNNPKNWATCSEADPNVCMEYKWREGAALDLMATDLECVDPALCTIDDAFTYLAANSTTVLSGQMLTMCFHEFEHKRFTGKTFCHTPIPREKKDRHSPVIPMLDALKPKHPRVNNPDVCGHYFMPYSVLNEIIRRFGGVQFSRIEIDWDDSSYAASSEPTDPAYDLIRRSTGTQVTPVYKSPFPDTDQDPKHAI